MNNRPLREHFEVDTDAGTSLRTFDYINELEKHIDQLTMKKEETFKEWTLTPFGVSVYTLTVKSEEGDDSIIISEDELETLREFLNSRTHE